MYLCEPGSSFYTPTKRIYHNRLNVDPDIRIQPDIRFAKKCKTMALIDVIFLEKSFFIKNMLFMLTCIAIIDLL